MGRADPKKQHWVSPAPINTYSDPTMQTTTETKNFNAVRLFAIDAGNRNIKWVDTRGSCHILPSYSLKLENWQDTPTPDSKSVVLEIDSDRYVVGQIAKELGGVPTYLQDKTALAHLLILAAIAPVEGSDLPIAIDRLRLALPNSNHQPHLDNLKRLEGVRTVKRNGQHLTYSIRNVEAIDECVGAYRYAKKAELFKYSNRPNGILDIGGGTALARSFAPSGNLIREADLQLPGTKKLARLISTALTPRIGYTPDLGMIMDGIADGSFLYGTTGVSFQKEFTQSHDRWLGEIRNQLNDRWEELLRQMGEVLIVGGSAPLLKSIEIKTSGRFKIAPNSQFIGVKGMLIEG